MWVNEYCVRESVCVCVCMGMQGAGYVLGRQFLNFK